MGSLILIEKDLVEEKASETKNAWVDSEDISQTCFSKMKFSHNNKQISFGGINKIESFFKYVTELLYFHLIRS